MRPVRQARSLLATAGVAAVLAGCGSDDEPSAASAPEPPSTTETRTASSQGSSPLEGTWRTGPITPREVNATLRRHDLSEWIADFRPITPVPSTTTLILDLHGGEWDLYGKKQSGTREAIDYDADYVVKGDEVEKIHGTGVTTYRWTVKGDTLTFEFLSTTEPPVKGIPDEVFSHALYMTEPFKRQP